jgi:outer membrane lipoprotein SlyB
LQREFKVLDMKKVLIMTVGAALLLSSCGTYTGSGAYTGATFGSILGSAIGGLNDGRRGSDIGTIVGMAGGAIIGGAIGSAKDRQDQREVHEHYQKVMERKAKEQNQQEQRNYEQQSAIDSGFDASNSGDDRLYDFESSDYTGDYTAQKPNTVLPMSSSVEDLAQGLEYVPTLEIRNARIVDDNQDGAINRNEISKVIFEIYNHGKEVLYDVQPTVIETTGNKHIFISPNMHVEKIEPGKGIRYTAMIKADKRLKDGNVCICVSVLQGVKAISKVCEFNVPTKK